MKNSKFPLLAIFSLLLVVACSKDSPDDNGPNLPEVMYHTDDFFREHMAGNRYVLYSCQSVDDNGDRIDIRNSQVPDVYRLNDTFEVAELGGSTTPLNFRIFETLETSPYHTVPYGGSISSAHQGEVEDPNAPGSGPYAHINFPVMLMDGSYYDGGHPNSPVPFIVDTLNEENGSFAFHFVDNGKKIIYAYKQVQ